jgi:anthranilate phosphoribosyltransferase
MAKDSTESIEFMRSILQRIATGPEMSKDISRDEARQAMELVLSRKVPDVQAGVYLVALRMKRETFDENCGVLDALRESAMRVGTGVDDLVDIADPYNGFSRHLPMSTFLAPVLAACGVPAVIHGCSRLGPKYGVTHHHILKKAGVNVAMPPEQAASHIEDPLVGWAYVDQAQFCAPLNNLAELRHLIVKRPCISTLEKLVKPISAKRTHLLVGYVHHGYEELLCKLAREFHYDSCLVVRGFEGGVTPMLSRARDGFFYDHGETQTSSAPIDPAAMGIETTAAATGLPPELKTKRDESPDVTALAAATAEAGLAALFGEEGEARDSLVCAAAAVLWHLRKYPSQGAAADAVREALDTHEALRRLNTE